MADVKSLLPSNASPLERALEQAPGKRLEALPSGARLWSSTDCPSAFLPWLAWALGVEQWPADASENVKRNLIASAVDIHRRRGTIGAIRDLFRALDLGEIQIEEGNGLPIADGAIHEGFPRSGAQNGWAEYIVYIHQLLTVEQADTVRRLLVGVAPARCHLWGLDFSHAALFYDGQAQFDGQYTYGVA